MIGRSFDRVLSDNGYAVITARDGPEALKKLAEINLMEAHRAAEAVQNAMSVRHYNRR